MRLRDLHANGAKLTALAAELTRARRGSELVEHVLRQEFRGGVLALELRQLVEIAVVQRLQHRLEHLVSAPDVDHDAVVVERLRDERHVDDEGRAMQRLRRPEHGAAE